MAVHLTPYVSFDGNAREAIEFYQSVFGGDVAMNTFGEFGEKGPHENQIMHAQIESPAGFTLMASDVPPGMQANHGQTIHLILHGDDEQALRGYWDALVVNGTVDTPLEKQIWGDTYGQCTDQFGIEWMFNIRGAH